MLYAHVGRPLGMAVGVGACAATGPASKANSTARGTTLNLLIEIRSRLPQKVRQAYTRMANFVYPEPQNSGLQASAPTPVRTDSYSSQHPGSSYFLGSRLPNAKVN